ncbi:MAG: hypothetical protein K2P81_08930 [Bacteriovoracaceae bacterium]|nr:hypothetical protein [Bacteriovoracaceae bacterium]
MENFLRLFVIPSPFGMDWESPASLARTAALNKFCFKPRFMGHVNVELVGPDIQELTGMRAKKLDAVPRVLLKGQGFGVLYHSFEGQLEERAHLVPELKIRAQEKRLSFWQAKLTEAQLIRLKTYLDEYRAENVGQYYGLHNRPLHGEGAGCSAFGVSFLEVAGLLNDELKAAWSNQVRIPLSLSGAPLMDQKVPITKILTQAHRWAMSDEDHKLMTYWDPDRMHRWLVENATPNTTWMGAPGVVIDATETAIPEKEIWNERKPKNYDGSPRR